MILEDYIDPIYFLIAFSIGLFIVLNLEPEKKIIIKYPTLFNLNDSYRDSSGNCWKYTAEEKECNGTETTTPIN